MIPVALAREPAHFDDEVRQPGRRALHERIGAEPPTPRTAGRPCAQAKTRSGEPITRFEDLKPEHFPDYWTAALNELYHAYRQLCAYSCFRIHPITGARSADHMHPKSIPGEGNAADEHPNMIPMSSMWNHVYEWNNYRLASGRLNARKNDYQDVIDPIEVGDDWFEMEFVGFQLKPGKELPPDVKQRIVDTIERLGLNDKEMRDAREEDYLKYTEEGLPFSILERESPLVAREVTRTGRLRPTAPTHAPTAPTHAPTAPTQDP